MKWQMEGVFKAEGEHYVCVGCGAPVVWAFDDRFASAKIGDLFSVTPAPRGNVILWYEVTDEGKPVGKQWFRFVDPEADYTGDRWSRHMDRCEVTS